MESDALLAALQQAIPGVHFEPAASVDRHATVYVPRDEVLTVAQALKNHPDLQFALLAEITAVDFWPREPRFEVVYVLVSFAHRARLRMKVRLNAEDAHVETVSEIWPAANWLEREVWDLFGIAFDRHPDPRRLLMPEDWEGFPLRKDSPVQIRRPPHVAEPLQVTAEEFRENVERDRLSRET